MRAPLRDAPFASLPVSIDLTPSRASNLILTLFLGLLFSSLCLLIVALCTVLVTDPAVRAAVVERPVSALQVLIAGVALLCLIGWPLLQLFGSVSGRRTIRISRTEVVVADNGLIETAVWRAPLASFAGISHRVVSSLSGVRHELLLVHPERHRSLLIWTAPHISQEDVGAAARLLNVAEISSRDADRQVPWRLRLGTGRPCSLLSVAVVSGADF